MDFFQRVLAGMSPYLGFQAKRQTMAFGFFLLHSHTGAVAGGGGTPESTPPLGTKLER